MANQGMTNKVCEEVLEENGCMYLEIIHSLSDIREHWTKCSGVMCYRNIP